MSEYIQIAVREEHVSKVYALLAQLDREESGSPPEDAPTPALDEELVARMYEDSWDTHRALLKYLAESPERWIYMGELAAALAPDSGSKSMAGLFGAFGRRANHRYGGVKPWDTKWDQARGENRYRMRADVATWIKEAAAS